MKGSTKIQTKDEKAETKKLYGEQLQQQQAAAKARKERMMEMDRERASKLPPTEQEVLTRKRDQGLLSKA
jgi:transcription initiation factor TFIID subunit TAF12